MKLKHAMDEKFAKFWRLNYDAYASGVIEFAQEWAELMETQMAVGKTIAECAGETAREADKDFGMSGFAFHAAVKVLLNFWVHGEELRPVWADRDISGVFYKRPEHFKPHTEKAVWVQSYWFTGAENKNENYEIYWAKSKKSCWPGYDEPLGKRGYWAGTFSSPTYIGHTKADLRDFLRNLP